ncbi:hypothetical protein NL676_003138 [Syzygium grande]|nr:hypothetical protein NL676_003138 [Syzygium grande]
MATCIGYLIDIPVSHWVVVRRPHAPPNFIHRSSPRGSDPTVSPDSPSVWNSSASRASFRLAYKKMSKAKSRCATAVEPFSLPISISFSIWFGRPEMMSLSLVSAFSRSPRDKLSPVPMAGSFTPSPRSPPSSSRRKSVGAARVRASAEAGGPVLTGVVFQPFQEVKREDLAIPISPQLSLARQYYSDDCEAAINEQINVEYAVSYVYHAMYAYFDRDNIALKGLAKFYKESSEEEREHAEKLMEYQNKRGGKVKLHSILMPPSEFDHVEKGDALYSMELALSLEKLTNQKLLSLHGVAEQNNDPQLADFIESEFLYEQVEAIKKMADFVTQLRMVGKGHGVWHFDQMLLHEGEAA